MSEESNFRVFVGGLAPTVTEDELGERFKSFGTASDVCVLQKKCTDGEIFKTFGYLNLKTTEYRLNKCFALFGGTKWKGHSLKVQLAKDDFMKRLRKEWETPESELISKSKKRKKIEPIRDYEEFVAKSKSRKAIPGAPLEGEKNWVIGKFGRPLPVMQISKAQSGGRKPVKHDPSKHCHCLKRIAQQDQDEPVGNLTWKLDEQPHLQDRFLECLQQRHNSKKEKFDEAIPDEKRKRRKSSQSTEEKSVECRKVETKKLKKKNTDKTKKSESEGEDSTSKEVYKKDQAEMTTDSHDLEATMPNSESKEENLLTNGDKKSPDHLNVTTQKPQKDTTLSSSASDEDDEINSITSDINNIEDQNCSLIVESRGKTVKSPPLVSSTPFVPQSSATVVPSNSREKPNAETSNKKSVSSGELSQSIVEQLLSRSASAHQSQTAGLDDSDYDDDSEDNSSSCDDGDDGVKSNLFDFTLDDLGAGAETGTKKPSAGSAEISEIQTDSDGNCDDSNDQEDGNNEESVNLFDFTFDNLKAGAEKFLGNIQMRWENEASTEEDSTEDEDSDKDLSIDPTQSDSDCSNKMEGETDADSEETQSKEDDIDAAGAEHSPEKEENVTKKKKRKKKIEEDEMVFEKINDTNGYAKEESCGDDEESKTEKKKSKKRVSEENTNEAVVETLTSIKKKIKKKRKTEDDDDGVVDEVEIPNDDIIEERTQQKKIKKQKKSKTEENTVEKGAAMGANVAEGAKSTKKKKKEKKNKRDKTTNNNDDVKHHKPQDAEAARQKSVEVRVQRTMQNKELVQNALRGLDAKGVAANASNKIRFDSDTDGEDGEDTNKHKNPTASAAVSSSLWDDDDDSEDGSSKAPKSQQRKDKTISFLTNDDSETKDEDEKEDADRFTVKPQFQGEQGQKLFKMQLHYADDRFKLDERFADNDNDSDINSDGDVEGTKRAAEPTNTQEMGGEDERARNLSLLGSILGKDLTAKTKSKKEMRREQIATSSNPYERYDPTKSDHVKFEVQMDEKKQTKAKKDDDDSSDSDENDSSLKKKKKKNKKNVDEDDGPVVPEVSKERFYKVETSLKSLFASMSTSVPGDDNEPEKPSTFSFLPSAPQDDDAGDADDADEPVENGGAVTNLAEAKPIKEVSWRQGLSEVRKLREEEDAIMKSNEDEDQEEGEENKDKQNNTFEGLFFFKENDERLKKGSKFRRTEDLEEIVKQWKNMRQKLHDDFKKKHKDAVRRVRKMKERKRMPIR